MMVTDCFHSLVETLSCPTYVTIFLQSQRVFPELFSIVIICDLHYSPVFIYFLQNRLPVNFWRGYLDSRGGGKLKSCNWLTYSTDEENRQK